MIRIYAYFTTPANCSEPICCEFFPIRDRALNMEKSVGLEQDQLLHSDIFYFYHDKQIRTFFCFAAVLFAIYYYTNYKLKRRRLEKIMEMFDGPPVLPVVGNGLDFLGTAKDVLYKAITLMKTYSSPFRIWILHKPYLVIYTPEDFQTVAYKTLEKDSSYRFIVDMLGDGIFTTGVDKWKRNRRVISPAFNPTLLFHYFLEIFNEQNINLAKRLEKEVGSGKHFDLWPHITQTSITTICETAMGYRDIKDNKEVMNFGNAMMKSAELVSQRFYKPWLMPSFLFTAYRYLLGYGNIFNLVHDLPLKMLKKRREMFNQMKNNNYICTEEEKAMRNFIDILLNFHEVNENFTDKELSDEVISIMFGGSETNAVTNCFTMLMLAIRQDIQEKVYQEIFEVFGDSNRLPELSDLNKLPYLEQCIKETLRRFPVVPIVIRHARNDIPISNGNVVPAGSNAVLCIYGIHHNPSIYPNPEIWDPSNFDPDKVAARHKCSFVPFSTGPRGCIGQKYAYVSMKAQLSTLLRNFKVTTDVKMENVQLNVDMIIRSADGYNIKLDYRHGESLF